MGWWLKFLLISRLSQPSLAEVGAGAELGNKIQSMVPEKHTFPGEFKAKDLEIYCA